MNTFSGSITLAPPLRINSEEARHSLQEFCGNPTASSVQWRVDTLEYYLIWIWYHVRIVVPFISSSNESKLLMQWIGLNYTNWTNQISQETDMYYSVNYSIIFIAISSVTIVLHKEEFESLAMNSNLPTISNCISLHC